jgi:subtilase family serine protease
VTRAPSVPIRRRVAAVLAVVLSAAGLTVAIAVPGVGAAALARLLPFGCANPAGHTSLSLLPAASGPAGSGVTCFGSVLTPKATAGPVGYGPAQIQSAYRIAGKKSGGRTVAVVVAYDNPKAESDLAVFRAAYHLPACTTANGCLRKVNQNGLRFPLPARDYGWAEESSLDLDAVSATCPDCHLLLVEATSPETGPLLSAVDTAVRLKAVAVSNSYGGIEDGTILAADTHLNHAGVAITASAGDNGYRAEWPASSRYVTAVGGTTLKRSSTARGWSETVWSGTGSGCSRYETKPTWQTDTGCKRRTVGDVAAVADPATGLGVYDTFNNCLLALLCDAQIATGSAQGLNGWAQVGGTSLSAPIVAAIYALAGNRVRTAYAYAHRSALFDVRSGSNGSCGGSYLCTAKAGYDGPTGLGTPNGLGAF